MRARLEVLRGAKTRQQLDLRLPTVVGRGREANLKLPASTVSRHHCELYEYDGQLVVRDLGSSNGTVVNGHKIMGPTFLTVADELTIGPVTMRLATLPTSVIVPDRDAATGSSELEEPLPDLQQLPEADSVLPVTAAAHEGDGHAEAVSDDDSELRYAEPRSSEHSFLRIVSPHEPSWQTPTVPPLDDGPPPQVAPDDSALKDFLKRLEP